MKQITLLLLFLGNAAMAADTLERDFTTPPPETRPGCYWYWISGQMSKEGITKDLEAMSRVGIGRAYIGFIYGGFGPTYQRALTDPWWDHVRHAIREGGRVGVDIGFFNAPGWSQSGGPWVKPEQAMRYVVSSEIKLKGPQKFSGALPKPKGMIQGIAVLAYPAPKYEDQAIPEKGRTTNTVTFESAESVTVRSLTMQIVKSASGQAALEVSEDGKAYRKIATVMVNRGKSEDLRVGPMPLAPVVVSMPPTPGRYFRLTFPQTASLGEVRLSSALRNGSVYEKQLGKMSETHQPRADYYLWPSQPEPDEAGLSVPEKEIRNLTSLMKPDGTLDWEVPAGDWIVERVGMAPTGTKNSPAPTEATGLEVDKINREPLRHHFDSYVGKLLASMPPEERKAFKFVVADSYEVGSLNWTDGFAEIFQKRYGYDPIPWLATLTGRVVESPEKSDRFLWDLRRLVADRIATEYVGGLRDLSHEKGLSVWLENYGHWGFPAEFLQYGGQSDEISGEFSPPNEFCTGSSEQLKPVVDHNIEVRCASSAAHIYGKNRVWSESYTGGKVFMNTPRELKTLGDWSFGEGVNQAVLHLYIHQPWEEKGPGVFFGFGSEFNRKNTWWNLAMKPWIDYQRKCSVMLQAGKPVADVAYFIGEDTPKMTGAKQPALPPGCDYDFINAEVILNRLSVKEGRLVLPEGASYRVLVLPPSDTMRPEVLRRIKVLVEAGATVVGPAPKRSPSLENYPVCDKEVEAMAKELWGSGKIRAVADLENVLPGGSDVTPTSRVSWKHRTDGNREIYFIANREEKVRDEKFSFRVKGKEPFDRTQGRPELWWPESGRIEPAAGFKLQGDRVEVPLHLEPLTSVFVVFGGRSQESGFRSQESEVRSQNGGGQNPVFTPMMELDGAWDVQFGEKKVTFEKLIPWPESSDPEIKYYSGEAVYRKEFELAGTQTDAVLDLGVVNAVAKVVLNGKDLGVLWKHPYRVDFSGALKSGKNTLEVTVVHTWHNRSIGDLQPGATPRAFISRKLGKATDELQPSGLLGPVRMFQPSKHE